jgi:hypothetical protein
MRSIAPFALLSLAACAAAPWESTFQPGAGAAAAPIVGRAVLAPDVGTLTAVDGAVVGQLTVSAVGAGSWDRIDSRAALDAADAGATHLVPIARLYDAPSAPASPNASPSGIDDRVNQRWSADFQNLRSHQTEAPLAAQSQGRRAVVRYVLVRVPESRWSELSPLLRPLTKR